VLVKKFSYHCSNYLTQVGIKDVTLTNVGVWQKKEKCKKVCMQCEKVNGPMTWHYFTGHSLEPTEVRVHVFKVTQARALAFLQPCLTVIIQAKQRVGLR
jgi:hypothetical protein